MKTSTTAQTGLRKAPGARPNKVRLTAAERRERFLDVASELIVESGLESVTMERVAERSGVSKALGYGYFENSDQLLAAVFEREIGRLDQRVLERIADVADARERLRRMMAAVFEVVSERGPLLGRLLQSRTHDGALEAKRRERQKFLETYFTQMIVEGAGVSPKPAAVASTLWLASVNGALDLWLSKRVPAREVVDVFSKMVVAGVQALRDERPAA